MKIFLDTSDVKKIEELNKTGLVDGITTNPTTLSQQKSPKDAILEICQIMEGKDVSVEVTEKEPEKVYAQAKEIADLSENVVVKIPCHFDYYQIIKRLVQEGINLNITLVFSVPQSLFMSKLGVKYISPFVGRLDDINVDGIRLLEEVRFMLDYNNFETKMLAASIRSVEKFKDAILACSDVITLPIEVFEESVKHELTDKGIKKFDLDWQKTGIKKFP